MRQSDTVQFIKQFIRHAMLPLISPYFQVTRRTAGNSGPRTNIASCAQATPTPLAEVSRTVSAAYPFTIADGMSVVSTFSGSSLNPLALGKFRTLRPGTRHAISGV